MNRIEIQLDLLYEKVSYEKSSNLITSKGGQTIIYDQSNTSYPFHLRCFINKME